MNNADNAKLLAVANNCVIILRVNIIKLGALRLKGKTLVLDVVNGNRNHVDKLEIKLLGCLGLAVKRDCKLLVLTAEIILINAVNNSSYLKNSEGRSIGEIRFNLTKLCRDHRASYCFNVRIGRIGKLNVRLCCNAELFVLIGVLPNV